ncbi:MAG: amidophosphoribosyltransferase [Myxococcales bacterium]|nr:amidophosphoribosyltransferase [Myxococcales bacterium]USN50975.1 MAG: amidophosphoribosyltransferase [Myxococcales bacterium]
MPRTNDRFRDKCGVVGIYGHDEAAHLAYLAMHALQHRGQDSAGIVTHHAGTFTREVGMGLVSDVFSEKNLARLKGNIAVGHVRYTTAGKTNLNDCQPILARTGHGHMAVAHNGNLVNADFLRSRLEKEGAIFQAHSDTEVICHLFAHSRCDNLISRLRDSLEKIQGAYSLSMMIEDKLVGARDPYGIRPLFLGKLEQGYVLASEDCSFPLINAQCIREVEPGELVLIDQEGVKSYDLVDRYKSKAAPCIFEHIYFARPDSHLFGRSVFSTRKNLGVQLAKESPVQADAVIAVPDSGVLAAMGYAQCSGIPYDIGLVRNHYVGRTFIEPEDRIRHFGVRLKLSPVREVVSGKKIVVVDDSIVRGTTSKKIVELLRLAGASEVHMRISAPMTTHPCHYGIATPTKEELIASRKSVDEIAFFLNVDSLAYLSIKGMYEAFSQAGNNANMCDACFSGNYPV